MGFGYGNNQPPFAPYQQPMPQMPAGSSTWNSWGPTGPASPYNPYVNPAYNPAQYAQTQSMINQWMQSAMNPRTQGERMGDLSAGIFNTLIAPGLAESSAPGAAEGLAKGMETTMNLEQQRREQYDQRQANYVRGIETFSNVLENTAPVKREQYQNWLDTQKAERDFLKMQQDMVLNKLQQDAARQGIAINEKKIGWMEGDHSREVAKDKQALDSAKASEARAAGQYRLSQNDEIRKQRAEADARARAETPEEAKQRRTLEMQEKQARIKETQAKTANAPIEKQQKDQEAADKAAANFAAKARNISPEILTSGKFDAYNAKVEQAVNEGYSRQQAEEYALAKMQQDFPKSGGKKRMKNKAG